MKTINVKIIDRVNSNFSFPKYITPGSAGLDLSACLHHPIITYPNKTYLIPTGIAIHINDINIAGIILPRSGISHNHGIILSNTVGLIDSDYQGEIMVSLFNRSNQIFYVYPGKRIAQILFISIIKVKLSLVTSFSKNSIRGVQGFGHSM